MKTAAILGLALALPSTIIGAFALLQTLVYKEILTKTWALIILISLILNILYLMVRYANSKKNKS